MHYNVVIADDEQKAIDLLSDLLGSFPDYHIVDRITDGSQLLASVEQHRPDLVLLDINMGDHNGIVLANEIAREHNIEIIFITAYAQYAIDAFEFKACDYLVKPISLSRLSKALKHFEEHYQVNLNTVTKPINKTNVLRFNTQQGYLLVKLHEIIYFEADQAYTVLYTTDGKQHHLSLNIGKIEPLLNPQIFVRSYRSYIINTNYLKEVSRSRSICVLNCKGNIYEVKLSKRGLDRLEELFHA